MSPRQKKGIILSFLTAIISGIAIFYSKLIVVKGIDPIIFNVVKNSSVAIILSLLIFFSPSRDKFKKLKKNQWLKLGVIAIVGGSIPFILFFQGLREAQATNASLIHKTLFIFVAAMAIPLLSEKLNLKQILGYLLIIIANFSIGGFSGFAFSRAELLILIATVLWAVENIIAKITLKSTEAIIVAWGRMFLGSLILLLIAALENKLSLLIQISPDMFLPIAGSILLLTGYVTTWYHALKYTPATIVTSVLIFATPITNILTVIFITHTFTQPKLLHTTTLALGVVIITFFATYRSQQIATK